MSNGSEFSNQNQNQINLALPPFKKIRLDWKSLKVIVLTRQINEVEEQNDDVPKPSTA